MPVYVHARYEIVDPEGYARYRALAGPSVRSSGGKVVLKGTASAGLEGSEHLDHLVVIEFPSAESARDWYSSPAYQAAKEARAGSGEMRLEIIQ